MHTDNRLKAHARSMIRKVFTATLRITVQGDPSILKASAGLIVTSNHVSFIDGVMLAILSDRYMHFAVETTYAVHNKHVKCLFSMLSWLGFGNVVPVDHMSPFGLRSLAKLLRSGECVMVFPEGAISIDGTPLPDQDGVEWLQKLTRASKVNLCIRGAEKSVFFGKAGHQLWPRITVTFPTAKVRMTAQQTTSLQTG